MTDQTAIPRHELLTKLLKMTTSSNDGEALTAIRKANDVLATAGWDWDRLMAGRITVIGDPFAGVSVPPTTQRPAVSPTTPQRPVTAPPPPRTAKRAATGTPTTPLGTMNNRFPGFCYCCGIEVPANQGALFNPTDHNTFALTNKLVVACGPCNVSATVSTYSASPVRKKRARTIDSLA